MKNLLVLFIITLSFSCFSQKEYSVLTIDNVKSVKLAQKAYDRFNVKARQGVDLTLAGILVTSMGVAALQAAKYNKSYKDVKGWKPTSVAVTILGSGVSLYGIGRFLRNKNKARKIEKRFTY